MRWGCASSPQCHPRALIGFRKRVRDKVWSRSRLRRSSPLGPFTGWSLCVPPARPCGRLLTRWRFCWTQNLALPQGGGVMRWGCSVSPFPSSVVIPGRDPGISCKVGLRSPGHNLATGPVMTGVGGDSEKEQSERPRGGYLCWSRSRALVGFRKRVRACVRSRACEFASVRFAACRQILALPRRGE